MISTIGPLRAAHKSWWDSQTGYAYLSGTQPGWRGQHLIIYDLRNPSQPRFVSSWGLPGQRPGDKEGSGVSLHHPVVSGNRAYLSYLFGGDMVILDIADKTKPEMISHLDFSPPYSGIHTTAPFRGMRVPNFTRGQGEVRDFLVLSEEAFAYGCQELRTAALHRGCDRGIKPGSGGHLQGAGRRFLRAGRPLRSPPICRDPRREAHRRKPPLYRLFQCRVESCGYLGPLSCQEKWVFMFRIPEAPQNPADSKYVQTNDVDLDYRGFIYITDRDGHGMHILEYMGQK